MQKNTTFENYLGTLKHLARKPHNQVSQTVRRIVEREHVCHISGTGNVEVQPVSPHRNEYRLGPLPSQLANCTQYKHYEVSMSTISCMEGNNCFVINANPVVIRNICSRDIQTFVVYEQSHCTLFLCHHQQLV